MVKISSRRGFSFLERSGVGRVGGGRSQRKKLHLFPLSKLAWCEVVKLVSLVCKGHSGGQNCTMKSFSAPCITR